MQRVPSLSDVGFWLPDGKHFVFKPKIMGDQRLFFITAE